MELWTTNSIRISVECTPPAGDPGPGLPNTGQLLLDLGSVPAAPMGRSANAVDPIPLTVTQPDSGTRPTGPIDWTTLLTTAQGNMNVPSTSPLLMKPAIDWESLGPVFLDDEAQIGRASCRERVYLAV